MAEPDAEQELVRRRLTLCLWGFMGTGKSTVGALVAAACGARFLDLDHHIEQRAGRRIREIFERAGEPAFRKLERESLADALQGATAQTVIALGGGALLDVQARRVALRHAYVVGLTATVADIIARTRGDATRPLLGGDADGVRARLSAREEAYRDVHTTVDTTGRDAVTVAAHLLKLWLPQTPPRNI